MLPSDMGSELSQIFTWKLMWCPSVLLWLALKLENRKMYYYT